MKTIFRIKLWVWFFLLQFPIFTLIGFVEAAAWTFLSLGIFLFFEEYMEWPTDGIHKEYYV